MLFRSDKLMLAVALFFIAVAESRMKISGETRREEDQGGHLLVHTSSAFACLCVSDADDPSCSADSDFSESLHSGLLRGFIKALACTDQFFFRYRCEQLGD